MNGNQFWLLVAALVSILFVLYHLEKNWYNKRERLSEPFTLAAIALREKHGIIINASKNEPQLGCIISHPIDWHYTNSCGIEYDRKTHSFRCKQFWYVKEVREVDHIKMTVACNDLNEALIIQRRLNNKNRNDGKR